VATPTPVRACGPFFEERLLDRRDEVALEAPFSTFEAEVTKMVGDETPAFRATPADDPAQQTRDADLDELRASLRQTPMPEGKREELLLVYAGVRQALLQHERELERWHSAGEDRAARPQLATSAHGDLTGIPPDFAEYTQGAIAFREARLEAA